MTTKILRYVSVGLTVALAGLAWGETMYMFSGMDGAVHFNTPPAIAYFPPANDQSDRHRKSEKIPDLNHTTTVDHSRYDLLVTEIARGYELDSALLHAVIAVESRYNPNALSPNGAAGLMQLMPATAKRYGVDNALDPEQNLRGGAKYLRDLLSLFGSDIRLALAAYHAGETAVARHQNNIPPFQATVEFVTRVLERYHKYRAGSGR